MLLKPAIELKLATLVTHTSGKVVNSHFLISLNAFPMNYHTVIFHTDKCNTIFIKCILCLTHVEVSNENRNLTEVSDTCDTHLRLSSEQNFIIP